LSALRGWRLGVICVNVAVEAQPATSKTGSNGKNFFKFMHENCQKKPDCKVDLHA
jgi:hypothetical protein